MTELKTAPVDTAYVEMQAYVAKLEAAGVKSDNGWYPIMTAPWETEILIGRWQTIGDKELRFITCKSSQEHAPGNEFEGEAAYDYWAVDEDFDGVVDSAMPDVWRPLFPQPAFINTYEDQLAEQASAAEGEG